MHVNTFIRGLFVLVYNLDTVGLVFRRVRCTRLYDIIMY